MKSAFFTIFSDGTYKFGNLDPEKQNQLGVVWGSVITIREDIDIQYYAECENDENNPLISYLSQCMKSALKLSPVKVFVEPSGDGCGNWY